MVKSVFGKILDRKMCIHTLGITLLIGTIALVGCSTTPPYRIPFDGIPGQTYDVEGKVMKTSYHITDELTGEITIFRVVLETNYGKQLVTFTRFAPVTPVRPSNAERVIKEGNWIKIRVVKIGGELFGIDLSPHGLAPIEVKSTEKQ